MGEMIHRLGSVILDNRDKGVSRVLREASIFPFDIVRGFNRALPRPVPRRPTRRSRSTGARGGWAPSSRSAPAGWATRAS